MSCGHFYGMYYMDTTINPEGDLLDNSLSSIEWDCDCEFDSDKCDTDYVASEFEACLYLIERSIANGDSLLERSKIHLGRLKLLHHFMLLPPNKFNKIDEAVGKLLASTFPAEAGLNCTPMPPWTTMFTQEHDMLAYKSAEKCMIEEVHKNVHVCSEHDCVLPTDWDNELDS